MNQKWVRKMCATMGSARATSITAENSCGTVNPAPPRSLGQPQRAEAGPLQGGDLVKWVLVVEVSVLGAAAI